MSRLIALMVACVPLLGVTLAPADARITKLEILRTEPAFGGASFGNTGAYEHVFARAYGELDPADPHNTVIQDLNLAPRNEHGTVEYSTEVELLKPVDMARSNRVLFFEVLNRGNKLALNNFGEGQPTAIADRNALTSPGDGWLMREGFTMVWSGWEQDVLPGWNRMLMPKVVAHNPDGSSITGVVRSEMTTPAPARTLPISLSWQTMAIPPDSYAAYPTAGTDNRTPFADGFMPSLTVRAREQDPRVTIPNTEWSFGRCDDGGATKPDETHLCYPAGFQPGRLYELIYRAKDPMVLGIGFAASRDLGSFLRDEQRDQAGGANPVWRADNKALIMGSSQSGRMIRSFLQLGFNQAENGRRVFDGAFPHIGGGLMPLNIRFGQPVRAWGEQTDHLYPA
ncbi:MAG: hypothetical protein JOZ05_08155, partial [Acetobacteraceae bacterium]|nr:hypothetical protein [Acetobacteraceae bacterium]